ncbi:aminopeptidase [Salix suchowensis]|nr:aminopeptidase [Salix suchowensis]
MQSNLERLSGFNNRYYRSSTGAEASNWILSTVQAVRVCSYFVAALLTADRCRRERAHQRERFSHSSWPQTSTIVHIAGKDNSGPVTILGAHMDSVNQRNPSIGRSPGADDDGSGSVNLIEAFRALVDSGFEPANPVEFHWYAAEEGGLLGSRAIASKYKSNGINVKGYMNLDMTAYFKPGDKEVVALMTDNTDAALNDYVEKLVTTYTRLTVARSKVSLRSFMSARSLICLLSVVMGAPTTLLGIDTATRRSCLSKHLWEVITQLSTPTKIQLAPRILVGPFLEFAKLAVSFAYELSA